jgi:hypothetical protein
LVFKKLEFTYIHAKAEPEIMSAELYMPQFHFLGDVGTVAMSSTLPGKIKIISRAGWGADEKIGQGSRLPSACAAILDEAFSCREYRLPWEVAAFEHLRW